MQTIDERLEAVTMNFETAGREIEELRKLVQVDAENIGRGQMLSGTAFRARIQKLAGHIPGKFKSLGDGAALCYQPLEFIRSREKKTFRQLFDLNMNSQFHLPELYRCLNCTG
jgi:hypothetical protein